MPRGGYVFASLGSGHLGTAGVAVWMMIALARKTALAGKPEPAPRGAGKRHPCWLGGHAPRVSDLLAVLPTSVLHDPHINRPP